MSRTRFDALTACLCLDKFVENSTTESPYMPIQSVVDSFNACVNVVIIPGKFLIVDECMSFWKGLEIHFAHESFIHVTYIPRKPVNLEVEFKCSADGQPSNMLHLIIQKGANAPKQRFETQPELLTFHCAVTLRNVDTGSALVAWLSPTLLLVQCEHVRSFSRGGSISFHHPVRYIMHKFN